MIRYLLLIVFAFLVSSNDHQRHHSHHHSSLKSALRLGNSSLVPGITISGAVVNGDHSDSGKALPTNLTLEGDIVSARIQNIDRLASQLPFQLTRWPAVFTVHCPQYPEGHKTERGLSLAHYRIWRDFVHFDPELVWRYEMLKNTTAKDSAPPNLTTISSEDGNYMISVTNGTFYKYNQPFRDEDIIAIFEDDADNTIVDLATTLIEEFAVMQTDVLYLGMLLLVCFFE